MTDTPTIPTDPAVAAENAVPRGVWIAGAVSLAAILAVVVVLATGGGDEPLAGIVRDPPLEVTGLEFVDYSATDEGEVADLIPDDGGVTLGYFGYLSCPDVCPTTMADIRVVLRDLDPAVAAHVEVAFVTVDPDRDTGSRLRAYVDSFVGQSDAGQRALIANATTPLDEAADRLGVYYEVAEHEPGDDRYDVGHSAVTYVIDDTGTVVRELPFGTTPDDIARIIRSIVNV